MRTSPSSHKPQGHGLSRRHVALALAVSAAWATSASQVRSPICSHPWDVTWVTRVKLEYVRAKLFLKKHILFIFFPKFTFTEKKIKTNCRSSRKMPFTPNLHAEQAACRTKYPCAARNVWELLIHKQSGEIMMFCFSCGTSHFYAACRIYYEQSRGLLLGCEILKYISYGFVL